MKRVDLLNEEIKKIEKERDIIHDNVFNSEIYSKLMSEYHKLQIKRSELNDKISAINKEINQHYLFRDHYCHPRYKNTESWPRNINEEVILAIKQAFGITNITCIEPKDIEKITLELMDYEKTNNPRLISCYNELEEIEKSISDNNTSTTDMRSKFENIEKALHEKRQERDSLRQEIEDNKILSDKNSKSVQKIPALRRAIKKEIKENFDSVLERVRNEYARQTLVSNLRD